MDNYELSLGYLLWLVIILVTRYGFKYAFATKSTAPRILLTFLLVSIVAAITLGITKVLVDDQLYFLNVEGFILLIAESLPHVIVFGGITYSILHYKARKKFQ